MQRGREREREKEPTNDRVNAKVLKSLKGVKLTKIFFSFLLQFFIRINLKSLRMEVIQYVVKQMQFLPLFSFYNINNIFSVVSFLLKEFVLEHFVI